MSSLLPISREAALHLIVCAVRKLLRRRILVPAPRGRTYEAIHSILHITKSKQYASLAYYVLTKGSFPGKYSSIQYLILQTIFFNPIISCSFPGKNIFTINILLKKHRTSVLCFPIYYYPSPISSLYSMSYSTVSTLSYHSLFYMFLP